MRLGENHLRVFWFWGCSVLPALLTAFSLACSCCCNSKRQKVMATKLSSTERVRSSCAAFTSQVASVDLTVVDSFAQSLDVDVIDCFAYSSDGLATNRFEKEINFASVDAEA